LKVKDNFLVPIRHIFIRQQKIDITTAKSCGEFFKKLTKVVEGAVKAYNGVVDPSLVTDAADFIATVMGSSSG
jgi:translation initiation factor 2 gamma subunit (eIF-2gamma)